MFGFLNHGRSSSDRVVLVQGEKCEFLPVVKVDETEIHTASHVFPICDANVKFDPNGGVVYMFNVNLEYLQECEHLKHVEKNIVIRNIFDYAGGAEKKADIKFYVMMAAMVLIIFILKK